MRRFITAIIATIALFTAEAQDSATTIIGKSFYGWPTKQITKKQ